MRRETAHAKAQRIEGQELRRLGWHESDLTRRSKGDPEKIALAARLRRETTLTIQQIAQRVHRGDLPERQRAVSCLDASAGGWGTGKKCKGGKE